MNKIIKDGLFGVIGGIAGTAVISQVMRGLSKLQSEEDQSREKDLVPEQPTEKLARKISEGGLRIELSEEKKAALGRMVYWGYGAFWGGVYGLLRRRVPSTAWAGGLPFGVGFELIGSGVMLPAMGLTPPATEFPVSSHARGLISHYAYAATVEGVCRLCEIVDAKLNRGEQRTNAELRRVS